MTTYSDKTGTNYQFGVGVSRNIWKELTLNLDFIYSLHKFSRTEQFDINLDDSKVTPVKTAVEERLKKIDFPVSFTYSFGKGNLSYFVRLGGVVSYITKSSLNLSKTYVNGTTLSKSNYNIKELRPNYYLGALGGLGVQYKVPRGYFVLDFRYHYGFQNMSVGDNKFKDTQLWSNYYYLDNNFCLDYLSINVGYHFTIYQSRKNRN